MNPDTRFVDVRPDSDEVTVRDVLVFLRRNFSAAAAFAGLGAIVAIVLVLVLQPEYTADITLLPESPSALGGQSGGLASQLSGSGLGGIASLAGISLSGNNSFKTEAVSTLGSRILTNEYIEQNDLMPVLFAKQWNPVTKSWKMGLGRDVPTLWRADRLFEKHIRVIKMDQETGLVTMTIRWKNAAVAAQWANGLVQLTNSYLKKKAIDEADRNIAYLNREIEKTTVVAVRNEIYALMEEEIRNEMVASGTKEFALKVIDPAMPPDKPSFPQPIVWIPVGLFGGLFIGYVFCVARKLSQEPK